MDTPYWVSDLLEVLYKFDEDYLNANYSRIRPALEDAAIDVYISWFKYEPFDIQYTHLKYCGIEPIDNMSIHELINIIQKEPKVKLEEAERIINNLAVKLLNVLTPIEITKLLEINNKE